MLILLIVRKLATVQTTSVFYNFFALAHLVFPITLFSQDLADIPDDVLSRGLFFNISVFD